MIESKILTALQKGVMAAVAASSTPALPVKYVGRAQKAPNDGKWLELIFIPNNIENEFWDSGKTYRGILRMILHWPMNDAGAYLSMEVLQSIVAGLSKGTVLKDDPSSPTVNVKITDNPNLLNVLEEPPELLLPASIRYLVFKA